MPRQWHRGVYADVVVPVPYYVGEFRDSDLRYPDLMTYEVAVGTPPKRGTPCSDVMNQLGRFEQEMQQACAIVDAQIPVGSPPASGAGLSSVLVLCANGHGEWIRIHPFANGNGRTARLWALWVGARYGLPPFIRIKPRPEGMKYAAAAAASMDGDHAYMTSVFGDMLAARMRQGPGHP
jgi:fido (protein-threonine AMPylation protein)